MRKYKTNFVAVSTRLLRYFRRNKGVGHTGLLFEGAKGNPNAVIIGGFPHNEYVKRDSVATYVNHVAITKNKLDELEGRPAVIDHQLIMSLLGDGLTLINALFDEAKKNRMVWTNDEHSRHHVPYFDFLVFRVRGVKIENVIVFNMAQGWYDTGDRQVIQCLPEDMEVGII